MTPLLSFPSHVHLHPTLAFPRNHLATLLPPMSSSSDLHLSKCSLPVDAPLKAILFDIDGTLCDSDPIHYYAFREMLQEIGFNGGPPITEEFFIKNISGMHNDELCHVLFPDWDFQRAAKFMDDKEDMFRRIASEQLKPLNGLEEVRKWIEDHGLKRAAVTNAPRPNAELIISMLGLADFFELLVIGSECERAKPFPDPPLKALQELGVSPKNALVFEESSSWHAGCWFRPKEPRKITVRGWGDVCYQGFQGLKIMGSSRRVGTDIDAVKIKT